MKTERKPIRGVIRLPAVVIAELDCLVQDVDGDQISLLGNDRLLTPQQVGRLLGVPTRHARTLMAEQKVRSSDIPGVGRRCTIGALRQFIRSHVGKAAEPANEQPRQSPQ